MSSPDDFYAGYGGPGGFETVQIDIPRMCQRLVMPRSNQHAAATAREVLREFLARAEEMASAQICEQMGVRPEQLAPPEPAPFAEMPHAFSAAFDRAFVTTAQQAASGNVDWPPPRAARTQPEPKEVDSLPIRKLSVP